jgi:hypothetical protein
MEKACVLKLDAVLHALRFTPATRGCFQGWKPDGFEKYLLGDNAAVHTEIFTRIEMDLLNTQLLRSVAVRAKSVCPHTGKSAADLAGML